MITCPLILLLAIKYKEDDHEIIQMIAFFHHLIVLVHP